MAKFTFSDESGQGFQLWAEFFKNAETDVPNIAAEDLQTALNEAEDIMHTLVHKITGNLDESIHQEGVTKDRGSIVVSASYAAAEEYRPGNHSFFRPGVQNFKDQFFSLLSNDISNYLQTRRGQAATARNL